MSRDCLLEKAERESDAVAARGCEDEEVTARGCQVSFGVVEIV